MNFGTLVDRVRTWRGTQSGNESTEGLSYIKETINSVYKELLSQEDLHWMTKEQIMEVDAPFTEGSLTVTVGLNVATLGTLATQTIGFNESHIGGKLHIGNTGMYYDVMGVDTLTAYLDRPYQSTSSTGVNYSLYRDSYPLPNDYRKMENVRSGDTNGYSLISRGADRFDKIHNQSLDVSPSGDPEEYSVWKRTESAWFTATCTLTNGNRTVDFGRSGPEFGLENWRHRCVQGADGVRYRVKRSNNTALTDPLQVELDRPYGGTSATSTVVSIDPRGTLQLQLWPPPTESNQIIFKYLGSDYDMVNDSDEPIVPHEHHDAIWKGAVYYIAQLDGEHPVETLDRLFRDWQESRGRLESYRTTDRDTVTRRKSWGGSKWHQAFNLPNTVTGYSG